MNRTLLKQRQWIAYIDDERELGNSIIVTLKEGWYFVDDPNCGVKGFDSIKEVMEETKKSNVTRRII